jgi:hypothetical protein
VPKLLIISGEILRRVKTWVYLHRISDYVGQDCVVGIAIRYGLDGPGIESRIEGEIFFTRSDRPWGSTQPPVQWTPSHFRR